MHKIENVKALDAAVKQAETDMKADSHRILVCAGTGCLAGGSQKIYEKIEKKMAEDAKGVMVEFVEEAAGAYHPVKDAAGENNAAEETASEQSDTYMDGEIQITPISFDNADKETAAAEKDFSQVKEVNCQVGVKKKRLSWFL